MGGFLQSWTLSVWPPGSGHLLCFVPIDFGADYVFRTRDGPRRDPIQLNSYEGRVKIGPMRVNSSRLAQLKAIKNYVDAGGVGQMPLGVPR